MCKTVDSVKSICWWRPHHSVDFPRWLDYDLVAISHILPIAAGWLVEQRGFGDLETGLHITYVCRNSVGSYGSKPRRTLAWLASMIERSFLYSSKYFQSQPWRSRSSSQSASKRGSAINRNHNFHDNSRYKFSTLSFTFQIGLFRFCQATWSAL